MMNINAVPYLITAALATVMLIWAGKQMRRDIALAVLLIVLLVPLMVAGLVLGWITYWVREGFKAGFQEARDFNERVEKASKHHPPTPRSPEQP